MPQAVTHILIPILLMATIRDFYLRKRKKRDFSLHYVLFAGLGGVLPDIDIPLSFLLNLLGVPEWNIHKTFTHSLFFPLILFGLFFIFIHSNEKAKICNLGKHKLKLGLIFLMLTTGVTVHILLDTLAGEQAYFFYPFSEQNYGINLFGYLPRDLRSFAPATLDGILLVIWIVYLELKHKISDFV